MRAYYQGKDIPSAVRMELDRRSQQTGLLKALRGQLTLADIADDPHSRRFAVSQVDASRMGMVNFASPNPRQKFPNLQGLFVDCTNIQAVPARGSTPNSLNGTISFTSTTTTITWTWTSLVIYRADGSTTAIPNGNITFSSLTANTPYWFYPYWSEASQTVNWAGGANTAVSITASQLMNAQYNVPLSAGGVKVTTPASGSGGGSGGGGANGCLHPSQLVWTSEGEKEAVDLMEGDLLYTPTGWTTILSVSHEECGEWRSIEFVGERDALVTPSQPFYLKDGDPIKADVLDAGQSVVAQYERLSVVSNTLFFEEAFKVVVTIQEPHMFYLWEGGPLVHNGTQKP